MGLRVMVVDDDPSILRLLSEVLSRWEIFDVTQFGEGLTAAEHFEKVGADIVLLDLFLPDINGLDVLERINKLGRTICIIITGHAELKTAIRAIRLGAFDFITKPISVDIVELSLKRALETARLRKVLEIEKELHSPSLSRLLGDSQAMQKTRERISIAASDPFATVLLKGESGTGKELAARAIHEGSPRSSMPFVPVNCAAIPESLLESELFGHTKGAFTGADRPRDGLFSLADGGSIFLDEIGEMPPALQAKLLRFLDDGKIMPVGGSKYVKTDLRVIAATNRDLKAEVEKGSFRRDLFFRLSVFEIELPPLRARGDDPVSLMEHYLKLQSATRGLEAPILTDEAKSALLSYRWPGNVRELVNLSVKLVLEHHGRTVSPEHLSLTAADHSVPHIGFTEDFETAKRKVIDNFTSAYFYKALVRSKWNIAEAARETGINRSYLHRIIKKYGIQLPDF
ncbi:MAG: sigma-54 dependent transcriptional regulator [Planctomycetota bacterium]